MVMEINNKHEGDLIRLKCWVQNYDWGIIGNESLVARTFSSNCDCEIEESKHYAELWMGTHDSGPSYVVGEKGIGNVSLKSWVSENPEVLGDLVVGKWGVDLPFMFKVLSVARALSIQAHPDKELAGFLHTLKPNVYKDANHKPEMVVALTEFEALCGFISFKELEAVLESVPEIMEVVGNAYPDQVLPVNVQNEEKQTQFLQSIFIKLMSAESKVVSAAVTKLISRLNMENKTRQLTSKEELALKLENEHPHDIGVIASFFFNHVRLNPGEALYISPNEPHAYLGGESVECMATSDNVVRAGLTPKHRDVKILCSMLTYKQGSPEILKGVPVNEYTKRYNPPFEEFEVEQCVLDQGASVIFPAVPGPSIFLVLSGQGFMYTTSSAAAAPLSSPSSSSSSSPMLSPSSSISPMSSPSSSSSSLTEGMVRGGDVLFAPANTEVHVSTDSDLRLFKAGVNHLMFTKT
ncbi:putative mannose-6-phosphate isomerase [Helianthus annuus]|uniref:Mannose-6-phosphate isomerase n=1 Tax=Helianthus annuus TaxID=4232 RepID=A0A251T9L0_HELAN|nr:mannose-6-phosphate isomerase 1 [Helianthus annuus]KAF5791405.1 putative mannose-6-phosphate isomerase [Helianthus annuus]KAJ0526474.1 putative mannose-6-phosphate isomerase [Helianthus annuus]KAJ0534915.1 putative mannose-6-phosphate isomerase [Helianthus annuus]KAJ0542866.1 putative mannose-6-phosphate isomerase [Helianthus annuus]KAJ0707922.1 putative mannose-6-phosphate isomerase [Helianthus annuus]